MRNMDPPLLVDLKKKTFFSVMLRVCVGGGGPGGA